MNDHTLLAVYRCMYGEDPCDIGDCCKHTEYKVRLCLTGELLYTGFSLLWLNVLTFCSVRLWWCLSISYLLFSIPLWWYLFLYLILNSRFRLPPRLLRVYSSNASPFWISCPVHRTLPLNFSIALLSSFFYQNCLLLPWRANRYITKLEYSELFL